MDSPIPYPSLLARSNRPPSEVQNSTATNLTQAANGSTDSGPASPRNYTLLVGGYAGAISVIQFNEQTRKLSNLSSTSNAIVGQAPSWITTTADGEYLYSANEVDSVDGRKATGTIGFHRLTYQNSTTQPPRPTEGAVIITSLAKAFADAGPVHVDLSPDQRSLIVASYQGGTASRYELNSDRSFKSPEGPSQIFSYKASGPDKLRQTKYYDSNLFLELRLLAPLAYIHQVRYDVSMIILFGTLSFLSVFEIKYVTDERKRFDFPPSYPAGQPTGRIAAFVDLGGDKVYIHSVDPQSGNLTPIQTIELRPGTGPRHLSFVVKDQIRTDIYLVCELSNEMIFIELTYVSPESIRTRIHQIISTLPAEVPAKNTYGAGEVAVSSDGCFVYGTNRQTDLTRPVKENSIVIFHRNSTDGRLSTPPRFVTLEGTGPTPRHLSLSPDANERWVAVVGQQADKLSVYAREPQGGGLAFVDSIAIAKPTVAQFLPF